MGMLELAGRFLLNTLVVWVMIYGFYYRSSHRRDYYFTFMLISISIFFMIFLLGDVKIKIGFALGLFAIFGIIRYRTESMPVREMTYLFCIIAISVINALAKGWPEMLVTDSVFILATWLFESFIVNKGEKTKLIQYDRIALITPDRQQELIDDLKKRTGLDIIKVEIGGLDFLRDMAMLKVHYIDQEENSVNSQVKMSKEQYTEI